MITLELAQVEIDYCTDCRGIWLDAGELEMLLGDAEQAGQLLNSFTVEKKSAEIKRKCPICLKKMAKIIVGASQPPVLIDKCTKGDGLWFDRGELKQVLQAGSFDQQNKVVKLLKDMFSSENTPNHTPPADAV